MIPRNPFCVCLLLTMAWLYNSDCLAQDPNEFYELRIYKISDYEKQTIAENYLSSALLPALERAGSKQVGVFTNQGDVNDHSIFMLIPFRSAEDFAQLNGKLKNDKEYQAAAAEYFNRPLKDPIYSRIESRFMRAFDGIPKMELPKESQEGAQRIFELRLYESHTEAHAARKVDMFNSGEIQIMKDVRLNPVFFGETLIGADTPNLVYMLSAPNMETHKSHWKDFLKHPEWKRMSRMKKYKDTVSKIKKWFLQPTRYSKI